MTYFGFLAIFLAFPIALLLAWHLLWGAKQPDRNPWRLQRVSALVIALHVVIALLYTTPWDNYLVATGVWWYDPARVTGLTLGWVPIEEYTFFLLQPILSGLLVLIMLQRLPAAAPQTNAGAWIRLASVASLALIWLISLITLLSGWDPGVYLSLELVWALPPIALQFAFGADILWRYRNGVLAGVLLPTLFLAAADMLAIGIGIWTIDPAQSLHLLIAGVLPFEELIFFLLTNTLIVFGVTLSLAPESRPRLNAVRQRLQRGASSPPNHVRRSAEW
jgi:lycopene cyclase domain-containing protein